MTGFNIISVVVFGVGKDVGKLGVKIKTNKENTMSDE